MVKIPEKLEKYEVYVPGKPLEEAKRELGIEKIIKLASNENPFGVSPKAVEVIRKEAENVYLYPDTGSYYLTKKLSSLYGIPEENILVGPGSAVIIKWITFALIDDGEEGVTAEKTFLIYRIAMQETRGKFVTVPMKDYGYDLASILDKLSEKTKIIFIANPNNPTGTLIKRREFDNFMKRVPDHVLVLYDEAYREYIDDPEHPRGEDYLKDYPNFVLLRTFSKAYGLAGMRIGYAIFADAKIKEAVWKVVPPFPVTFLAQKAAIAALGDSEFVEMSFRENLKGKEYLYRELDRLGLKFVRSQANFIFVIPPTDAREIVRRLFKKGVIVRHTRAFGAPEGFRVTVGSMEQNKDFIKALEDVLEEISRDSH